MGKVIVATAPYEGGYYSPIKDPKAPIRFYSDRTVEDDILYRHTGRKRRERLSRKEFRRVKRAASQNLNEGRI